MIRKIDVGEDKISLLREHVSARLGDFRFSHTLGAEKMVITLGEIYLPDRIQELRAAALLHDVTKELSIDEQLELIDKCDLINKQQRCPEAALHSFSGAAYIYLKLQEFASEDIIYAVMNHTLGSPNMNLFGMIVYLSDFIEVGRKYKGAEIVRRFLFDSIEKANNYSQKLIALYQAINLSIDFTVSSLIDRGLLVDDRTIQTKVAISALI